jgi:hypothetical protein
MKRLGIKPGRFALRELFAPHAEQIMRIDRRTDAIRLFRIQLDQIHLLLT